MFFCPFCSTLLLFTPRTEGNALVCATCRYIHAVSNAAGLVAANAFGEPVLTISHSFAAYNRQPIDMEEDGPTAVVPVASSGPEAASAQALSTAKTDAEDVLDTSAEGGQIMTIACANEDAPCDSTKAYFIQIQMRSADEPATVFFKCVKCGYQWRQD